MEQLPTESVWEQVEADDPVAAASVGAGPPEPQESGEEEGSDTDARGSDSKQFDSESDEEDDDDFDELVSGFTVTHIAQVPKPKKRKQTFDETQLETAAKDELRAFLTLIRPGAERDQKQTDLSEVPIDELFRDPTVRTKFPFVTYVALQVLAICASSAFIERLFSKCGILTGRHRHNMKMETLINLLYVQYEKKIMEAFNAMKPKNSTTLIFTETITLR
jgi:hypothetical protein